MIKYSVMVYSVISREEGRRLGVAPGKYLVVVEGVEGLIGSFKEGRAVLLADGIAFELVVNVKRIVSDFRDRVERVGRSTYAVRLSPSEFMEYVEGFVG